MLRKAPFGVLFLFGFNCLVNTRDQDESGRLVSKLNIF